MVTLSEETSIWPTNAAKTGAVASPSGSGARLSAAASVRRRVRPVGGAPQFENAARNRSCCEATSQRRPTGSGERAMAKL